jgi:hypothetical protein
MKQTLKIEIECGEKTCASEPGKFCFYFGRVKFGQVPTCCLFPSVDQPWIRLEDKDGWVQRCEVCLKSC